MVGCPQCGESSRVEIVRDPERPWDHDAGGAEARWNLRCDGCGSTWTMVDHLGTRPR